MRFYNYLFLYLSGAISIKCVSVNNNLLNHIFSVFKTSWLLMMGIEAYR